MAESLVVDRSFGRVSASDADMLGDIVYSLTEASEVFQIDNSTGVLSLIERLDFETESVLGSLSHTHIYTHTHTFVCTCTLYNHLLSLSHPLLPSPPSLSLSLSHTHTHSLSPGNPTH